jgi:hypothetical protein
VATFSFALIDYGSHCCALLVPVPSASHLLFITMLTEIKNSKSLKKAATADELIESICAFYAELCQSENSFETADHKISTSKLDACHNRGIVKKSRRKKKPKTRKKHKYCSDDSCNADCKCRYASRECRPGLCRCTNCSSTFSNRKTPLLEVRQSNIPAAKLGLFAEEDISGGTFLGEYKGPKYSAKRVDEDHQDHKVTRFTISPSILSLRLNKI